MLPWQKLLPTEGSRIVKQENIYGNKVFDSRSEGKLFYWPLILQKGRSTDYPATIVIFLILLLLKGNLQSKLHFFSREGVQKYKLSYWNPTNERILWRRIYPSLVVINVVIQAQNEKSLVSRKDFVNKMFINLLVWTYISRFRLSWRQTKTCTL